MPNVLATYDRLPEGRTLEAFVDGQADDLAKQARRFALVGRREVLLDGRRGIEIVFRWDAGSGLMRQRQVYVALDDGRVITVVNTALDDEFEAIEPVFGAMLSGFRWVSTGAAD
ncbi:DcrB-related protein [Sphingomonas sp. PP-CE-1G-424]|uniref:DcrB-related protein n=1 Tax=Sphingomonas sp. PP-CE-1G-424 TaxID=2135658 RepID=UPI00105693C0|nr:DcrB-related protein [Sphingomonas sp. PP-CE-1G-424]